MHNLILNLRFDMARKLSTKIGADVHSIQIGGLSILMSNVHCTPNKVIKINDMKKKIKIPFFAEIQEMFKE